MSQHKNVNALTAGGVLVSLGIVFGDIGTSPLYVMKAILGDYAINSDIVLGGISCVFWTLTLQTTIKYVLITLSADNHGEGGIFALYALVKKTKIQWLIVPAIIGGSALLADGIITPPISISSAVEGIRAFYPTMQTETIVYIVIAILFILFTIQQFGTKLVGKFFAPMMLIWFAMLGTLGTIQILKLKHILLIPKSQEFVSLERETQRREKQGNDETRQTFSRLAPCASACPSPWTPLH